jgi:hypothetical protein
MQRSGQDAGEDLAAAILKATLIVAAIILIGGVILLAGAAKEFARIYTSTALTGTRTALVLWLVLAAVIAVLAGGGLLALTVSSTTTPVLLTCGGSLLVFVVLVAACDWHARQQGLGLAHEWGDLDRYLHF